MLPVIRLPETEIMRSPTAVPDETVHRPAKDGIAATDFNYRASASLQNIWEQIQSVTVSTVAGPPAVTTKIPAGKLSAPFSTSGTNPDNNYTVVFDSVTLPAVYVNLPDLVGREQILRVHAKKISLSENVDLQVIARGTPGGNHPQETAFDVHIQADADRG